MFGSGLFQPMHLLLILIVVLIIFGPSKLPELGRAIGKSIREFKNATSKEKEEQTKQLTASIEDNTKKSDVK